MRDKKLIVGVIGGTEVTDQDLKIAYEVGTLIAQRNAILVCGGLGGIMEAACKGAYEHGGITIGVLPTEDKESANPYVTIPLPTGMGHGRNMFVIRFSDVIIAFPGSYGTLNEITFALVLLKCVIYMPGCWNLQKIGPINSALFKEAFDANHAIGLALSVAGT